jgi:putative transposase
MHLPGELICGNYYHIYNRGINSCNLFREIANYQHFIALFEKYIKPIAETYAWVLMPNHFHCLVRIRENMVYKYSIADKTADPKWFDDHKWETIYMPPDLSAFPDLSACAAPDSVWKKENESKPPQTNLPGENPKIPKPHLHFSHFFNAYSKHFNTLYDRHGALFERPFNRKLIDNEAYLKKVIVYIHNNPVHHGFCNHTEEYQWSSYLSFLNENQTIVQREKVIALFGNVADFTRMHANRKEYEGIEDWLGI